MAISQLPKVSVLIPAFNASLWIRDAVDSCLSQEGVDLELVIVDDGSSDDTQDVLKSYGSKLIVESASHAGASAARNRAFSLSTGAFIQYLDADDYLLRGKLSDQATFLNATGADMVYGDWQRRFDKRDGSSKLGGQIDCRGAKDFLEFTLRRGLPVGSPLYRRHVIELVGGWNERLPTAEDFSFRVSVALSRAQCRHLPGLGYVYRRHFIPSLSTTNVYDGLFDHLEVLTWAHKSLQETDRLNEPYASLLAYGYFSLGRAFYVHGDHERYRYLKDMASSLDAKFRSRGRWQYRLAGRLLGDESSIKLAAAIRSLRQWSPAYPLSTGSMTARAASDHAREGALSHITPRRQSHRF